MSSRADPRSLPSLVPRLTGLPRHSNTRIVLAFWLLGLINNVLYVIILSAAQDLVGTLPKGIVLLADVVPSFVTKLVAPYFIHAIPYRVRVAVFIALSFCGMLLIASAPPSGSVGTKLLGVVLASLSSGGGELSFLGLTHHYGAVSLAGWGSGTGAAGLVGAGLYVVMTDWWRLSVSRSLMVSAFLPVIMLVGFFVVLPPRGGEYKPVRGDEVDEHPEGYQEEGGEMYAPDSFRHRLARTKSLVLPYMVPLFVVFLAEYIINQGVSPTLLFDPSASPFRDLRDFYPFYGFLYQLGVFLSRSSTPFVRLHRLYPPALLQVANLVLLTLHALFDFLPNVYVVFFLVFWEGLLGGAVYVNCFAEIMDSVAPKDREFSLGAATVSDSAGICVAGLVSVFLETGLCRYQVAHGRDWCRRIKPAH